MRTPATYGLQIRGITPDNGESNGKDNEMVTGYRWVLSLKFKGRIEEFGYKGEGFKIFGL